MAHNGIATVVFACTLTAALAAGPAVVFSQEVSAFDQNGNPYPALEINPSELDGMQRLEFPLQPDQMLVVETNLEDPKGRGVAALARTVARCLRYVEQKTGRRLRGDLLIYLIELDRIPLAYRFEAAFDTHLEWLEVRLALIQAGEPLRGPRMASSLADLLYDTLPHELGHDVLRTLPGLLLDTDRGPSRHTRWFAEGICEALAKGFAAREAPHLLPATWGRLRGGRIIEEPWIGTALFQWEQQNSNPLQLESDLYGAALLATLAALERIRMRDLMDLLATRRELDGKALLALLQEATGRGPSALLRRARDLAQLLEPWEFPSVEPVSAARR